MICYITDKTKRVNRKIDTFVNESIKHTSRLICAKYKGLIDMQPFNLKKNLLKMKH